MPCPNPRQPIPTLSFGTDLVVCALAADLLLQFHTHDRCLHLPDGFRIARTSKTNPAQMQNRRRVRPISEQQLEAELNISGRADRVRDHSRARASDGLARKIELRVIQNVEELAAELQVETLGNQELFEDGEVQVGAAGSPQNPSSGVPVSELSRRGPRGARRVEVRIEPVVDCRVRNVPVTHQVRTARTASIGDRVCQHRREREASLFAEDQIGLPVSKQRVLPFTREVESPALTHGRRSGWPCGAAARLSV